MKNLHLWKPELKKVYVQISKKQKKGMKYLQLPDALGLQELKEDVKNGAVQYQEIVKYADGDPQRFTIISAYGLEEGLKAVTYLASCYREKEAPSAEKGSDPVLTKDGRWICHRDRIPVFGIDDEEDRRIPYEEELFADLLQTCEPNVILTLDEQTESESICYISQVNAWGDRNLEENKKMMMAYHESNRHVFYVYLKNQETLELSAEQIDEQCLENQNALCSLMLDHDAEYLRMKHDKLQLMNYYRAMFASAVRSRGVELEKGWSIDPVLRQVDSVCDTSHYGYGEMLERVIRYAVTMKKGTGLLRKEDFAFLTSFTNVLSKQMGNELKFTSAEVISAHLVGMDEVKEQIRKYINLMKYNLLRKKQGKKAEFHNTFLFLGAPGTAKTTAAHLMGALMQQEHLLPGDRFLAINGAELKGQYVGHTAHKVHDMIENHDIILIDEAYALTCSDSYGMDSFSQEAIAQLIIEMEEHGSEKLIIFAGYGGREVNQKDNKMKQFLESNPGIRSRINGTIIFDSYDSDQMMKIFRSLAAEKQILIPETCDAMVRSYFEEIRKMPNYGNGREARKLLEQVTLQAAIRMKDVDVQKLTKKEITEYREEDVRKAISKMKESLKQQMGVSRYRSGFYQV